MKNWWDGLLAVPNRKTKWPEKTQATINGLLSDSAQIWQCIGVSKDQLNVILNETLLSNENVKVLQIRMANIAILTFLAASCRAAQKGLGDGDTQNDEDE